LVFGGRDDVPAVRAAEAVHEGAVHPARVGGGAAVGVQGGAGEGRKYGESGQAIEKGALAATQHGQAPFERAGAAFLLTLLRRPSATIDKKTWYQVQARCDAAARGDTITRVTTEEQP
jgi:hypothetical protein